MNHQGDDPTADQTNEHGDGKKKQINGTEQRSSLSKMIATPVSPSYSLTLFNIFHHFLLFFMNDFHKCANETRERGASVCSVPVAFIAKREQARH